MAARAVDHRRASRKRQKPTGILCPLNWYTRQGLREAMGMGHQTLAEMRDSGMVKPIAVGSFRWYRGSEVIEWMEAQAAK
jgi:hypothetical protein